MDPIIVAALIAGGSGAATALLTNRSMAKRIGNANGHGPVSESVDALHDLVEPLVESQYFIIDSVGELRERVDKLERK